MLRAPCSFMLMRLNAFHLSQSEAFGVAGLLGLMRRLM